MGTEKSLTPREIVAELDVYIVGQDQAKRAVAVAVRNRWRRQQLPPEMRDEVAPKNIIMIGPTGVGKTEIARRLAGLSGAPFIKVEASKYTEVGYHGRDVESMVRDLVKLSVTIVRAEQQEDVREHAEANAEERLLDALLPQTSTDDARYDSVGPDSESSQAEIRTRTREKLRKKLHDGQLDQREIEIDVQASSEPIAHVFSSVGGEELGAEFQSAMDRFMPKQTKTRRVSVAEAQRILVAEEAEKLLDEDAIIAEAIDRAENQGIIFIDEIDKIAGPGGESHGPDISREGVQRDLLPIVEGTTVTTRHGVIKTDHILFIAAGAFHMTKPSDLIPELQGRFPIRVELQSLGQEDFVRILTHPKNALTKQYQALLSTEGITLKFSKDALERIAAVSAEANRTAQDIGARRLHTVMERLLEDISFNAPDLKKKTIAIDCKLVDERLKDIVEDEDLTKYVL